jgi:hypothetical protein
MMKNVTPEIFARLHEMKTEIVAMRRFSILPGSAADADQGEPFFLIFALPPALREGLSLSPNINHDIMKASEL